MRRFFQFLVVLLYHAISYLTAVGVFSGVGHREQVLLVVLELKAGGLVLELSTVDALAARAVALFEVTPLALKKSIRRRSFDMKIYRIYSRVVSLLYSMAHDPLLLTTEHF